MTDQIKMNGAVTFVLAGRRGRKMEFVRVVPGSKMSCVSRMNANKNQLMNHHVEVSVISESTVPKPATPMESSAEYRTGTVEGANVLLRSSHNVSATPRDDAINRSSKSVTFLLNKEPPVIRKLVSASTLCVEGDVRITDRKSTKPTRRQRKIVKSTRTERVCACSDPYCNIVAKFLGSLITRKCSYSHPLKSDIKTGNKRVRCESIFMQILKWRRERNERFVHCQVPEEPHSRERFNEIHYPILFLREYNNRRRIPESLAIAKAKIWNMFDKSLVVMDRHYRKQRVVAVPTLSTHEAIQVNKDVMF